MEAGDGDECVRILEEREIPLEEMKRSLEVVGVLLMILATSQMPVRDRGVFVRENS